jgi:hypothetical protein
VIPKIIYSCWVSDEPLPTHHVYVDSWRRAMPDYEIRVIGEADVPDTACTRSMRERGKMVTVAQYAAFAALYRTGGIYMDLDVEVLRPFDDLLGDEAFLGIEHDSGACWTNCAVIGARKNHPLLAECLDYMDGFDYDRDAVENELGPRMFTNLMIERGWDREDRGAVVDDVHVLPSATFYPYPWDKPYAAACIGPDTLAVHHWASTWVPDTVSVVIPCFNHGEYLAEAIESALGQTMRAFEVIVVNDGSTDDTSTVTRRYPRVRLIEQPNRGLSAARNAGITAARGRYILCLDADDMLMPTAIEDMLGLDDIVCPSVRTFGSTESVWIPPLAHPTVSDFAKANHCICAAMFLREAWERVGGYDEVMRDGWEDWDFWARVAHAGSTFTVVSDELLRYRVYDEPRPDRPCSSSRARVMQTEIMAYLDEKWRALGIVSSTANA